MKLSLFTRQQQSVCQQVSSLCYDVVNQQVASNDVNHHHSSASFKSFQSSNLLSLSHMNAYHVTPSNIQHRNFASLAPTSAQSYIQEDTNSDNSVFRALDVDAISRIKADFEAVDENRDKRICADELKALLRKSGRFSDSEIVEISEIFYAGKAGKPVPFEKLLDAIDNAVASTTSSSNGPRANALNVGKCAAEYLYEPNHHVWKDEDLQIKLTHVKPKTLLDKFALSSVKLTRFAFDNATGWNNSITTEKVLQRVIFLETVAAVPGMVAAIIRHFKSLRHMERDGGLINMFLEEANNERMHLLTFVGMKNPGLLFRASVIGSQFVFGTAFFLSYAISPKFCHRFVGYIEEEACSTYTKIIDAIESAPNGSDLAQWRTEKAPKIGQSYWKLGRDGTVLDLMYAVRADEAEHRDVNHHVVGMKAGEVNPRFDPAAKLDQALIKYVKDIMSRPSSA